MKNDSPNTLSANDDEEIKRHAALLDTLEVGLMVFSPEATLLSCNSTANLLLGNLIAQSQDSKKPIFTDKIQALEEALLTKQPVCNHVMSFVNGETESTWLSVNAIPFLAANGTVRQVLLTLEDITDIRELQLEIGRLTNQDPHTGTLNQRTITRLLEIEIRRAQRYGTPFTVAQVGIDPFVTDGAPPSPETAHQALAEVGKKLSASIREMDMVGRMNHDEFLLILPNVRLNDAIIGMERLRARIEAESFTPENLHITISGGITEYTGETSAALLERSQSLLINAREAGHNRFCLDGDIL